MEDKFEFPYDLIFKPTGDIAFPTAAPGADGPYFTDSLQTIKTGSVLYNVFALDKPTELGGKETHIADLVTKSEMVTS